VLLCTARPRKTEILHPAGNDRTTEGNADKTISATAGTKIAGAALR
jgi:hypothetical protein